MHTYASYMNIFAHIMSSLIFILNTYITLVYVYVWLCVCADSFISVPILMNVQPYISLPSLSCGPLVIVPRSTPPSYRSSMCAPFIPRSGP